MTALDDAKAEVWNMLTEPFWAILGENDDYIFNGLNAKTVGYLRDRIAEHPDLRATLARAADYRQRYGNQTHTWTSPEFVYFISADDSGLVKIGSASDPIARLRVLQTGSPERLRLIATLPGGSDRERSLHGQFAHLRVRGEWFRADVDLIEFIGSAS